MSLSPQDEFEQFMRRAGVQPERNIALAFFVGYASGAGGVRQNIEEIVAAFNAVPTDQLAQSESRP